MVMLLPCRRREDDFNIRVESFKLGSFVVDGSFEVDAIQPWLEALRFGKQIFAAAVCVGNRIIDVQPASISQECERNRHSRGRTTERSVENMCRDAHGYSDSNQR